MQGEPRIATITVVVSGSVSTSASGSQSVSLFCAVGASRLRAEDCAFASECKSERQCFCAKPQKRRRRRSLIEETFPRTDHTSSDVRGDAADIGIGRNRNRNRAPSRDRPIHAHQPHPHANFPAGQVETWSVGRSRSGFTWFVERCTVRRATFCASRLHGPPRTSHVLLWHEPRACGRKRAM